MAERRKRELTKQVVVRVDERLYAALERDAEAHGRTLAQTVRFLLRGVPDITPQA
jgi:hypothetical protein